MDRVNNVIPSDIINEYKSDIDKLLKYIPWLESKSGADVMSTYHGNGNMDIAYDIPIYDGTLLQFIKLAQTTKLMDRNYPYLYSRNFIKTVADEKKLIQKSELKDIKVFKGILSRYVMLGRTRGTVWKDGVDTGIFLLILKRLQTLIERYDKTILENRH